MASNSSEHPSAESWFQGALKDWARRRRVDVFFLSCTRGMKRGTRPIALKVGNELQCPFIAVKDAKRCLGRHRSDVHGTLLPFGSLGWR